ncbi:MAG: hypothetical protein V1897_02330 [Pseudomonadota bacterium]
MDIDGKIDRLIEAGWYVLDSEFDDRALAHWKKTAGEFLISFLGPRHLVTESFICYCESKFEPNIFQKPNKNEKVQ